MPDTDSPETSPNQSVESRPPVAPDSLNQDFFPPGAEPAPPPSTGRRFNLPTGRRNLTLAGAVLVFVFLVGGYFAYATYSQSPSRVLGQMFKRFPEVKTFSYGAELKTEVEVPNLQEFNQSTAATPAPDAGQDSQNQQTSFVLSSDGVVDNRDAAVPRSAATIKASIEQPGQKITLAGEYRQLGNTSYAQLTEFPDFGLVDAQKVKGRWVRLDKAETDDTERPSAGTPTTPPTPTPDALSPDQINQVKETIRQSKAARITDKLKGERLDGQAMHHYKYEADKDAMIEMMAKIQGILSKKPVSEQEIVDARKDLDPLEFQPGEIWIGKKDYLPHKLTINFVIKKSEFVQKDTAVQLTLGLKNLNQELTIEPPGRYITGEQFLQDSGFSEGLGIDGDKDGLNDDKESRYGSDPIKPDSDGDGFKDGEEVNRGFNPAGPGRLPGEPLGTS